MKRGRPTKLTPELQQAIVSALEIGATRTDAVASVGIDYHTFLNWLEQGQKERSGIFFQFFQAVTRAEASARIRFTSTIARAAADGDWRAALEYLKRRDRANWGDAVNVATNGDIVIRLQWADDVQDNDSTSTASPSAT